jgi:hypothetical protein
VQLPDRSPDPLLAVRRCLDDQQKFFRALNFAFPTIDRMNPRNHVHARRHLALDKRMRDLSSLIFGSGRRQDEQFACHIESASGPEHSAAVLARF